MNLTQALRKHAEVAARIAVLEERMLSDIIICNGVKRYTDREFKAMYDEIMAKRDYILKLKLAVNIANNKEINGESVAKLLAKKASSAAKSAFLTAMKKTEPDPYRTRLREQDKIERRTAGGAFSEQYLDSEIDRLIQERRRIDDEICDLNAKIEVEFVEPDVSTK